MANARIELALDKGELIKLTTAPGMPVVKLANQLGRRVTNSAKQRAPVDTGNLRNSIRQEPVKVSGGVVSFSVVADADYASFVHDGTRPHVIRPRNAKVLAFSAGGTMVFASKVNHPGTKARPFLRNALEAEAPRLGFAVE